MRRTCNPDNLNDWDYPDYKFGALALFHIILKDTNAPIKSLKKVQI